MGWGTWGGRVHRADRFAWSAAAAAPQLGADSIDMMKQAGAAAGAAADAEDDDDDVCAKCSRKCHRQGVGQEQPIGCKGGWCGKGRAMCWPLGLVDLAPAGCSGCALTLRSQHLVRCRSWLEALMRPAKAKHHHGLDTTTDLMRFAGCRRHAGTLLPSFFSPLVSFPGGGRGGCGWRQASRVSVRAYLTYCAATRHACPATGFATPCLHQTNTLLHGLADATTL